MPGVIIADPNGTASALSAEGELALARGNTAIAQQKHDEAGRVLERRMKAVSRAREKHYLRFLAATQFYKGGHYQHAAELAEKIDPKLLDARARELLPPFLKDVRERSSVGYPSLIQKRLNALWVVEDWNGILVTLAEHQFVIPSGAQAWLRGVCCRHLGNLKASALFLALAFRDPVTKAFALESASYPILLWAADGHVTKAEEYARLLSETMPNAVLLAAMSFVEYAKLTRASDPERIGIAQAQLAAMERATAGADDLVASAENDGLIRTMFALAAAAAAETCRRVGDGRETRFRQLALTTDRGNVLNLAEDFCRWDTGKGAVPPQTNLLLERAQKMVNVPAAEQKLPDFRVAA